MTATTTKSPLNRIISVIGWQAVVLMTVLYATVHANDLAQDLLTYYGIFLLIPFAMYGAIVLMPQHVLDKSSDKIDKSTKTGTISRLIGTSVSLVEIALLINYNFYWIAAIWVAVEILQYAAHRRMSATIAINETQD